MKNGASGVMRWFSRTTGATLLILVLYTLSLGPVLKASAHAPFNGRLIDFYFVPYSWLLEACPPAGKLVQSYLLLWVSVRPCISSSDEDW
jgi:hypothetical protein